MTCPDCGREMVPEHAHHKCPECGYIEPCCDGAPMLVTYNEPPPPEPRPDTSNLRNIGIIGAPDTGKTRLVDLSTEVHPSWCKCQRVCGGGQ